MCMDSRSCIRALLLQQFYWASEKAKQPEYRVLARVDIDIERHTTKEVVSGADQGL